MTVPLPKMSFLAHFLALLFSSANASANKINEAQCNHDEIQQKLDGIVTKKCTFFKFFYQQTKILLYLNFRETQRIIADVFMGLLVST